ncbi:MAG: hypothetical protein R2844_15730 [Caldilineales bacterium]
MALPAPFVFGWREVFIPLAVVVHDQHGPALVMAGLAVAAARVGSWLVTRGSAPRRVRSGALLAALALFLLGLTPEEGPAGLLLWLVFGIAWSLVEIALVAHPVPQRVAELALLAGMALAGPLAQGPGAWLIAALCLGIAWRVGPAREAAPGGEIAERPETPGPLARWLPFLFSASYMTWFWLVPARLLQEEMALGMIGVLAATHWLARLLTARFSGDQTTTWQAAAALALAVLLAVNTFIAGTVVATVLFLILSGLALGVVAGGRSIARPDAGQRPGESQALGDVFGPAAGALLVLVFGQPAAYIAGALAAAATALVLVKGVR